MRPASTASADSDEVVAGPGAAPAAEGEAEAEDVPEDAEGAT